MILLSPLFAALRETRRLSIFLRFHVRGYITRTVLGSGYEFERPGVVALPVGTAGALVEYHFHERLQVLHIAGLAHAPEERLAKAQAALWALTPGPDGDAANTLPQKVCRRRRHKS